MALSCRGCDTDRNSDEPVRLRTMSLCPRYGSLPTRQLTQLFSKTARDYFLLAEKAHERSPTHRYYNVRSRSLEGDREGLRCGLGRNREWGWHRPCCD